MDILEVAKVKAGVHHGDELVRVLILAEMLLALSQSAPSHDPAGDLVVEIQSGGCIISDRCDTGLGSYLGALARHSGCYPGMAGFMGIGEREEAACEGFGRLKYRLGCKGSRPRPRMFKRNRHPVHPATFLR